MSDGNDVRDLAGVVMSVAAQLVDRARELYDGASPDAAAGVGAGDGPMTLERLRELLSRVHFPDKAFRAGPYGHGWFVQIEYLEDDVRTGESSTQRGRKWVVSRHATESEVVQTCLTACLASAEHQVREHFTYQPTAADRPRAIFGPHFSSRVLYGICGKRENYDAREDPA